MTDFQLAPHRDTPVTVRPAQGSVIREQSVGMLDLPGTVFY